MPRQLIVSALSRTAQQKHDNNETLSFFSVVDVRAPFSLPAARVWKKKRLWAGQAASGPAGGGVPTTSAPYTAPTRFSSRERGWEPSFQPHCSVDFRPAVEPTTKCSTRSQLLIADFIGVE